MAGAINNLYIHVPFCRRKCGYCAFYSTADTDDSMFDKYLGKLAADLDASRSSLRTLDTIFVGGGTPTLLSAERLDELFHLVKSAAAVAANAEISVECNPEELDGARVSALARHANRVSIGVQSLIPRLRWTLGRGGEPAAAAAAARELRAAGINNLGADLIYGIPGQTLEDWRGDLRRTMDIGFEHLSAYCLTIEEGSRLAAELPVAAPSAEHASRAEDERLAAAMWAVASRELRARALRRYEVSNYARAGRECRHNAAVWSGQAYLGLGPAAASYDGRQRWRQISDLKAWLAGAPPEIDLLPPNRRAREVFAVGLRACRGWDTENSPPALEPLGADWRNWRDILEPLAAVGLLVLDRQSVRPTPKGMRFWDDLAAAIIDPD